ncbi:efflux RND transporter permease subunit [Brevibacillus nitrificans]|uniref:Efflux RND transporter permease subunit n=1 Tax=Brevibacillus nitrificans TaxID=651560 RepID=A0A3M8DJL2_9BACL|nr:efflux RND transporter permease subunit [Brevibacillus nitrificans]RNB88312.1 efflux RND transporter permease subunit [Brevibacillus nitrificans]
MNLSELSIKRPVTMIMLTVAMLIFGFVSLPRLAIDLMPELNFPVAVVVTSVDGGSPSEVEKLVTKPIENALGTVSDLDSISSVSIEGASQVILMFNWGTDLDQATLDMREKVDQVRGALPDSAHAPRVLRIDPNSQPIIQFAVTGDADVNKLKDMAEDLIQSRLERIDGVASAAINGGQDRVIDVIVDPAKLSAYGLTLDQIQQSLGSSNLSGSAGAVREGDGKLNIRVQGEFANVEQIALTPISVGSGGSIRLSDIAQVNDTTEDVTQLSYVNGKPSLGISITKASGGNTIEVADAVIKEMEQIKKDLPENIQVTTTMDTSTYIKDSIYTTAEHALLGGLVGIILLFFFLGSFQSMIIAIIVLPVSIVATFLLMYMTGQTINLISLSGLTLGLGSLIDFAVVMLENIFRQREKGKGMMEAALVGSKEVGTAVMASALAQICVFLPIALTEGIAAELFGPLALTVVFSHIAALVFSILLVPMLSSRILKKVPEHTERKNYKGINPVIWFNIGFHKVEKAYAKLLGWALGRRKTVIAAAIIMMVGSLALTPMIGAEFIPSMDQGQVSVSIKMPSGTVLAETEKVTKQVEEIVNQVPEKDIVGVSIGSNGSPLASTLSSNQATISLKLVDVTKRQRSSDDIVIDLTKKLKSIAGPEITVSAAEGMSTGSPIELTVRGDDLEVLKDISGIVKGEVESVQGTNNVTTSLEESRQEFEVKVDAEKASLYGLTTGQILSTVRTSFQGQTVTKYRTGDDEIDVKLQLPENYQEDINYLNNLRISAPGGAQVALSSVATISKVDVPLTINRSNMTREVKVTADLAGRDLNAVSKDIQAKVDKLNLPDGYKLEFGGQSQDMAESFGSLALAIVLSVVLLYMVMAAQFESLYSPFIIMFSVPPTVTGVLLGLLVTGTSISVSVLIGYILLIGLVVNNAIVLIDYINQLRAQGWELRDAILHAGPIRLRPILMTTLTTILAIGPLAFAGGSGTETQAPMAITVIFGLSFSTLITLVLVPVVTSWFDDRGKKRREKRALKKAKKEAKKNAKNAPALEV